MSWADYHARQKILKAKAAERTAEEAAKRGITLPGHYTPKTDAEVLADCDKEFDALNDEGEDTAMPKEVVLKIVAKQATKRTRWGRVNAAIDNRDLGEVCWSLAEIAIRDLKEKGFVEIESLNLKEILRLVSQNNQRVVEKDTEQDEGVKAWLRRA